MNSSGLYLVTLASEELISTQTHDARRAADALKVNCENIKLGRARLLAGLEEAYTRTFGKGNPTLHPIARVAPRHLEAAVQLAKIALWNYRVRSPRGRRTEWVKGIGFEDVRQRIINELHESSIPFTTVQA
jgi:hypothetical protein